MAETRKLAAILVADVVGYSRLAGVDEDRILARLRALRSDLIDPTIAVHHGRVVKRTGDGAIVEFRSVVDAVNYAVEIQNAMAERNAGVPEDRRIVFRVGIHTGDVVEESDGDLMGDAVNVAARLEGICEPGGVCLSSAAYEQVRGRVKETFVDVGEKALKNISRAVHAYTVRWDRSGTSFEAPAQATSRPSLPDKPSIAVLPFQNMSGDPEQEYFADGMVEDIVTGLSRIKWLFVIARNSSFIYKGKAIDVRQAGRELGVRYILEGGVRKAGQRLRVTAQLVEAETGAHLWADKFDGELKDIFELQDQITESVVGVVEPSVRKSEIERSRHKRPDSLEAYDLFLRALPYLTVLSPANLPMAAQYLKDALDLEPNYATAHAHLAWCHQIGFHHGGLDGADKMEGLRHARMATTAEVDDATALAVGALVIGLLAHDWDAAFNAIERAVSLNPSSSAAYYLGAFLYGINGQSVVAAKYARRALRLSPFDPLAYHAHMALAFAAIQEDRYDEAVTHGAKLAQISPNLGGHVICYAVALALAGRIEEARLVCARALEIEPAISISQSRSITGSSANLGENWERAYRLLGVPE
jgi:TolB-like protein/class 3 adenylate cyclase/Flp pilus assembly protein TadD